MHAIDLLLGQMSLSTVYLCTPSTHSVQPNLYFLGQGTPSYRRLDFCTSTSLVVATSFLCPDPLPYPHRVWLLFFSSTNGIAHSLIKTAVSVSGHSMSPLCHALKVVRAFTRKVTASSPIWAYVLARYTGLV